jgi:hypothetical protein
MKTLSLFVVLFLSIALSLHAQDDKPAPGSGKHNSQVFKSDKTDDNSLMTFDGTHASSRVSSKLVRKRNTGIVLTAIGAGMFTTGIALAATAPYTTSYYPNGSSYTRTSAGGLIGTLMIPASFALTIPGAVIWGRYAHKIKKAQSI